MGGGVPLDELAAARVPTLVVSGAHHEAFDAICDVLEARLGAERLVLPGSGHNPQLHPGSTRRSRTSSSSAAEAVVGP